MREIRLDVVVLDELNESKATSSVFGTCFQEVMHQLKSHGAREGSVVVAQFCKQVFSINRILPINVFVWSEQIFYFWIAVNLGWFHASFNVSCFDGFLNSHAVQLQFPLKLLSEWAKFFYLFKVEGRSKTCLCCAIPAHRTSDQYQEFVFLNRKIRKYLQSYWYTIEEFIESWSRWSRKYLLFASRNKYPLLCQPVPHFHPV